jgi:hypothetical protein
MYSICLESAGILCSLGGLLVRQRDLTTNAFRWVFPLQQESMSEVLKSDVKFVNDQLVFSR